MDARIFRLMLCVALWAAGHDCHQWSSQFSSGTVKYACVGSTAVLPWAVTLNNGEDIHDIQWHFDGPSGRQTVAFFASGMFMPGPAFAQRVSYVPNAGIMLTGLTKNDTGNYSVEVTGRNASLLWSLEHTGFIQVLDGALVSSTGLHLKQEATAIYDNATGQWMVDLSCGDFPFPGQPPFDVKWTTPSGNSKPSAHYEKGQFHLYLTHQEMTGQYSCEIPSHGMCSGSSNSTRAQASLVINEPAARLAVLESQFKHGSASAAIAKLIQQNAELHNQRRTFNQQNSFLKAINSELKHRRDLLMQENTDLSQKLLTLEKKLEQLNNTKIPENNIAACPGLSRTLMILDTYLNQSSRHTIRHIEAANTEFGKISQKCSAAQKELEHDAIYFILSNQAKRISTLKNDILALNITRNNQIQSTQAPRTNSEISFHARADPFHGSVYSGNVIVLHDATLNEGGGYNRHTGCFTAPESGSYLFFASVKAQAHQRGVTFHLMAGTQQFDSPAVGGPHFQDGTLHAIVHLLQSQEACLKSNGTLSPASAIFSGFLIKQDHRH